MTAAQQKTDRRRALAASLALQERTRRENDTHSLRDYFAAQAMQHINWGLVSDAEGAKAAYVISDAMLKARNGDNDA